MSGTERDIAKVITRDEAVFHIKKEQLPLHCPLLEMSLWNQHPRVYLPINDSGKATCPYCGTEFILEE